MLLLLLRVRSSVFLPLRVHVLRLLVCSCALASFHLWKRRADLALTLLCDDGRVGLGCVDCAAG
eukprot:3666057-Rhodomonas_salina.1